MEGRTNAAGPPRRGMPRAADMSARKRREATIEIIASVLERAVGEHTCVADGDISYAEESAVDGLELSTVSTGA